MTVSFIVFSLLWAAILGACSGGFAAVVIYRANAKIPLWGHSRCPVCDAELKLWEVIPIVSWILLMGRCRSCRAHISKRYLVIELCATLFFLVPCAIALLGVNSELEALKRLAFALGCAETMLALCVIKSVRKCNRAAYWRTEATVILLVLAWFAAAAFNPMAVKNPLIDSYPTAKAGICFIVISSICAIALVLAITAAFKRDLRANLDCAKTANNATDHDATIIDSRVTKE